MPIQATPEPVSADAPEDHIEWFIHGKPTVVEVRDGLQVLLDPEHAVELRALNVDRGGRGYPRTFAGFFDIEHAHDMARAALNLPEATGIYFMLNPVHRDLLARINNEVRPVGREACANDSHVIKRRWLLIDGDPKRESGISSTDEEKAHARDVIRNARACMRTRGWPDPIVADSGNGYHLLYRIDLPAEDGGLIQHCLRAMARRFDTAQVMIDTSVFNPARICKLYGTRASKGADLPERPHRYSRILHIPGTLQIVPQDLLEALAAEARDESTPLPRARTTSTPSMTSTPEVSGVGPVAEQAAQFLAKLPEAVAGEHGHDRTFHAACSLVVGFGLPAEDALPIFRAWNETHCKPPWDEQELQHKLDDAARKAAEEPGRVGHLLKKRSENKGTSEVAGLMRLAKQGVDLFHSPEEKPYAGIVVAGRPEVHAIGGLAFKNWLIGRCYDETGRVPGAENLRAALGILEHQARLGPCERVHVRVAEAPDADGPAGPTYFLDLANAAGQVVKITRRGWEVVEAPEVRFLRPKGMLPLPTPARGGSLDDLRPFVNVSSRDWPLFKVALTAMIRPVGPYPVLVINGEQGSAKTTTSRVIRMLIDPHISPLRSLPKDERDLMIAASKSHLLAFDNISRLRDNLSDSFCRIANGGGLSTRALYTDDEETHFNVKRPILLNGIDDFATKDDLLDRIMLMTLPRIGRRRRQREESFWREFDEAYPRILGALLDAVAGTLAMLPQLQEMDLPRTADFAYWGEAASQAMGERPGRFSRRFDANRRGTMALGLENSPVAEAVRDFTGNDATLWRGTATDLLALLGDRIGLEARRAAGWPKTPRAMGGALRQIAPALRAIGIDVRFTRDGHEAIRTITITNTVPSRR